MKTQRKTKNLSEMPLNLDITKSKFSLDESQPILSKTFENIKPESYEEEDDILLSKEVSTDQKADSKPDSIEHKECLLCGNDLHPIYDSLDVTRGEVCTLK